MPVPGQIRYFPTNCSEHPSYLNSTNLNGISFCSAMTFENCLSYDSNYTINEIGGADSNRFAYINLGYNKKNNDGFNDLREGIDLKKWIPG